MAEGKEIKGAQRGIAFSTGSALAVSVLILIVGAGANSQITGGGFKILQLVPVIKEQLGEVVAVVVVILYLLQNFSGGRRHLRPRSSCPDGSIEQWNIR